MGALPYSLLLFTVLACGCSAALTTRDLATAGDHLIVFDPITGLEWLALGRTYRMEATQVVKQLRPGQPLFGWRHASLQEVVQLWTHAGLERATLLSGRGIAADYNSAKALTLMLGSWAYPTTSYVGRAAQDTRPNRVRVAAGFVDDPAQFPIADTAGPRTGQWLTSTEGEAVEGPRIRTIAELRWDDDLRQATTSSRPASSLSQSYGSYLVRYAADPKRTEYVLDHACVKGSV